MVHSNEERMREREKEEKKSLENKITRCETKNRQYQNKCTDLENRNNKLLKELQILKDRMIEGNSYLLILILILVLTNTNMNVTIGDSY